MYIKKFKNALFDIPRFMHRTLQPRLIMTLLVKNEEDMIAHNLEFHKKMGVDAFIVTDNNSSDGTMKILEEYQKKGWILEIIEEKSTGYRQKVWVDRMVCLAKKKYKADWVINADADEFWYARSGSLKNELSITRANVLRCPWRNMIPEEDKPFWQWTCYAQPVPDLSEFDLSPFSIYTKQNKKVAHRTNGYLQISMGNHKVTMFPRHLVWSKDIVIYHFSIRGRKQFISKMTQGGKEIESHPAKHAGRHWRYFYQLYKENKLEQEYERVVGLNSFDRLKANGYIQECPSIEDLM